MNSFRFYVDYVIHFLASHSRHGTHSPFVYQLVDEVIYAPRKLDEPSAKVQRLISRLINRFGPEGVYRIGDPLPIYPMSLVIAEGKDSEAIAMQIGRVWPQFRRGGVLILVGLYRDRRMKELWRTIQERPDVTVTIDLFHLGLVFLREGQAKENFRIRF
ncbi:hypothetical protein GCM10007415_14110 [Parapedobacter pyrenivorans]|uniref:Uncharacterized protein n=1 Tax=Parapedobacter pyrenivorans TaxID=1305674 RepID=A0A917HLE8_9SPHI|nr:hypothetical protein [Parapedobacter pyrenivorans]GGG82416.1 hypothetical protein GCM10007415_14110 [Parapedobacter pyrenivorans]